MDFSGIFQMNNHQRFQTQALELFQLHAEKNPVYSQYLKYLNINTNQVKDLHQVPFLPIGFFKSHEVLLDGFQSQRQFLSSGTTQQNCSTHHLVSEDLYLQSFSNGFKHFFGNPRDYVILALLPSYLEQGNSSLVFMVDHLIKQTQRLESGFYLDDYQKLVDTLETLESKGQQTLLIGVSYALLDLINYQNLSLKHTLVMETGGMKGRRRELIKSDLHKQLKAGFGVTKIYSEYGMTELLSQAYSLGDERYQTAPWMQVMVREVEDPFHYLPQGKTGGINVIDLANYYSCPFIETQDLGKIHTDGSFEILGRFDFSDIRGCNLMVG